MRGPRGRADEIAIHVGLVCRQIDVHAADPVHFRADRGVGGAFPAFEHARSAEHLKAMANRRHRLVVFHEMAR